MKLVIENAGLTPNDDSFDNMTGLYDNPVQFQVPFRGETNYPTYRDVAELLIRSYGTLLRLNDDAEVEYLPIQQSFGTHLSIGPNQYDDVEADVDYGDFANKMIWENKHLGNLDNRIDFAFRFDVAEETETENSILHDLENVANVTHGVADTSTSTQMFKFRKAPRTTYVFNTSLVNIDTKVGDYIDLTLKDATIKTGVMVTTVNKSHERAAITCIDLSFLD